MHSDCYQFWVLRRKKLTFYAIIVIFTAYMSKEVVICGKYYYP
ncbi:hypothetical protein CRENPOLYSF1_20040 [Crenothrix polyspora]|uniref:Uncharacterized protein n=1 Tax=Crenothrix polyspora TaxID=360316 RepID=A0A1R4H5Q8_9GAMM|nr:hypothetical protein CRENPOLYSF1_20040 [Crenothrix polyspora]